MPILRRSCKLGAELSNLLCSTEPSWVHELIKASPTLLVALVVPTLTYVYALNQSKSQYNLQHKHDAYLSIVDCHSKYQSNLASMVGGLRHSQEQQSLELLQQAYELYQDGFDLYKEVFKNNDKIYIYAKQAIIESNQKITNNVTDFNDYIMKEFREISADISVFTPERYDGIYNESNKIIKESANLIKAVRKDIGVKEK